MVILLWMIKVSAAANGRREKTDISWKNGLFLMVLNSKFIIQVQDVDEVVLKVTWQIQQLLNLYSNIAFLSGFS